MNRICPKCSTLLPIPDNLLKKPESKLHCYKCGNIIDLDNDDFDLEEINKIIRQVLNSP